MELNTLQRWLWRAASSIRGEVDAARYKDYILPLVFYKRIDDVFGDELARVAKTLGVDPAPPSCSWMPTAAWCASSCPLSARWRTIRGKAAGLGETITDNLRAIARENPDLAGVIDRRDFNATEGNQRVLDDNTLARLIDILSEQRLGLRDVQPDLIGRAYEYLIRKFAERGSSAGEFFTPTRWASDCLYPGPGRRRRGLRPHGRQRRPAHQGALRHRAKVAARLGKAVEELAPADVQHPVQLFGQELQADNVAAAKMNAFIHDLDADIRQGNTMRAPAFVNPDGSLRRFRRMAANPMWNQNFTPDTYNNDTYQPLRVGARRPPAPPTGAGCSTCTLRWSRAGAWPWCSTPAQPAGAAATRAGTPSATSASSSWSMTPSSA